MQRQRLIGVALTAFFTTCTVMLALGQARYTGTPADTMRVRVVNSGRTDAVPVSLQDIALPGSQTGLRVEVANRPTVVLDPTTVVNTRLQPRSWEYKLVHVQPGQDDDTTRTINAEGAQGWEAAGVLFTSAATGQAILLKRQK